MHANRPHGAEPLNSSATVRKGNPRLKRLRRNILLLAMALVAVVAGVLLVIDRESESQKEESDLRPNKTIVDYLAANNVTQSSVQIGDQGSPTVLIPPPPGWSDSSADKQPSAYSEFLYDDAINPDDIPFIEVLLSRVNGAVDPAMVLEYAPGELRNLPDYRPVSEPSPSKLSGFDAVQLAGIYTKNGEERLIAQKTVVIPTGNALFVLQMNADAPTSDALALQLATAFIDEQAKVLP